MRTATPVGWPGPARSSPEDPANQQVNLPAQQFVLPSCCLQSRHRRPSWRVSSGFTRRHHRRQKSQQAGPETSEDCLANPVESLTLIPRTQFGSAQIHPVGEHRQGLPRQGDLQLSGLCGLWPGEAPSSSRLAQTQSPVLIPKRILSRLCRRLVNTNRAPFRGSSPNRSVTRA